MNKDSLLKTIAETGYNVGFGARKTFATFDIASKGPGWIGLASFAFGTFALFTDEFAAKVPSAILLIAGVASLYIGFYRSDEYEETAKHLLKLHYRLRDLYRSVQSGVDLSSAKSDFEAIQDEYYSVTVSKQIFLSDWYAHYKFFAQSQTEWMDEQLHFGVWKDMIPLSAKAVIVLSVAGALGMISYKLAGVSLPFC
jgi:hypothetical protein